MFNQFQPDSWKKKFISVVVVWILVLISVFMYLNSREKIILHDVPVYKQVFNEQCDFSILEAGMEVNFDGKLETIENATWYSGLKMFEVYFE